MAGETAAVPQEAVRPISVVATFRGQGVHGSYQASSQADAASIFCTPQIRTASIVRLP